jgi:hypothetical protein
MLPWPSARAANSSLPTTSSAEIYSASFLSSFLWRRCHRFTVLSRGSKEEDCPLMALLLLLNSFGFRRLRHRKSAMRQARLPKTVLFRPALRRVPSQQRQGNDGERNSNIREQKKELRRLFRPARISWMSRFPRGFLDVASSLVRPNYLPPLAAPVAGRAFMSHRRTVRSEPPEARTLPSGLKATDRTAFVWPVSVRRW